MRLTRRREPTALNFADGGIWRFRPAESLDIDIATAVAGQWGAQLLSGGDVLGDFGWLDSGEGDSSGRLLAVLTEGDADVKAFATHLYAVALALRVTLEFTGFTDGDDIVLTATRAALSTLLSDPSVQSDFLTAVQAPLFERAQAGNA